MVVILFLGSILICLKFGLSNFVHFNSYGCYNYKEDIVSMNSYSRIDDVNGVLKIDKSIIDKVNKAIYEDYYDASIDQLSFKYTFENGYMAEILVVSDPVDEETSFLNPILFDNEGFEISYLDAADYTRLDDEFVFIDSEEQQEYKLLVNW